MSGPTATLTFICTGGSSGQTCSGPITSSAHVTTQGNSTVAVRPSVDRKKKPKPKPKVTKVVTVATGSYSIATGGRTTVTIALNSAGQKLLTQFYKLPTTLTIGGIAATSRTVTFSYSVIRSPISFTWAFNASFSMEQALSVSSVPPGGKVTVICHGGGCPFGKRAFSPRGGRVSLTSALAHSKLRPHTTITLEITATNQVGKVALFTILSGQQPALAESCLPPGARSPSRCA
jgi:hypothetical protein